MVDTQRPAPHVLATDLDGTLIPLADQPDNRRDLRLLTAALRDRDVPLVFVTGRHLESVLAAIDQYQLPWPHWIVCDVGTSIYHVAAPGSPRYVESYAQHLDAQLAGHTTEQLREQLVDLVGLRLQEEQKQGRFKLSYYTDAGSLTARVAAVEQRLREVQAPYSVIHSVDPFNGDGLIDLLPRDASKAHALDWWVHAQDEPQEAIVFAGDSGNDLAVFTAGYRVIIVGNADPKVVEQAQREHQRRAWQGRLYCAKQMASSGVLEGCRWYALLDGH